MVDPRTLRPLECANVVREHLDDEWVPFLDELERAYLQMWARNVLREEASSVEIAHQRALAWEALREE